MLICARYDPQYRELQEDFAREEKDKQPRVMDPLARTLTLSLPWIHCFFTCVCGQVAAERAKKKAEEQAHTLVTRQSRAPSLSLSQMSDTTVLGTQLQPE